MSLPILLGVGIGAFAGLVVFGDVVVGIILGVAISFGYAIVTKAQ